MCWKKNIIKKNFTICHHINNFYYICRRGFAIIVQKVDYKAHKPKPMNKTCNMKNLEQHIVHLIARHNCVIIPEFGAFLAYNVPAHYNIEEQTFMPPHRALGFNPQVKVDDALLTSQYMNVHNLSYEAAAAMLHNDILSLKRTLSRKGTVRFGELGSFSMNINSEITFEAAANSIDDPENFGFTPLQIAQVHNIEERTITIKRRDISKYIAAIAAIILTFIFVTPISEQAFEKSIKASMGNFASSEHISMMQQLTSEAPQQISDVTECEISPINFSRTKAKENTYPNPTISNTQTNDYQSVVSPPADSKNSSLPVVTATTAIQENTLGEQPVTDTTLQQEESKSESAKQFHIIVASSPNADNAQLAIRELSIKMQSDYKVIVCGKRHRVAVATYATEREALDNLSTIQATFPDAWILNN